MEPSLFRYIWAHTRREQIVIMLFVAVSMIPYYLAFDLPKQIVNGPLTGTGFETEGATRLFMAIAFDLPWIGHVTLFDGIAMERLPLLMALSLTFLALVIVNGLFKYAINTRKGRMGERLLRRVRYELIDRVLRFPPARFRQLKSAEVSSMVKDEIEPIGGFAGDAFSQPILLGGQALTAMLFIFVQHFWLGMVAAIMAGIQVAIIPRMRRRLIILGRQRQLTARELAGRVGEIVDGIQTIHASDTTNWERADITWRLGRIFKIRYDIYQWKFLVKFINNLLAQMTPFLFYAIGGYLTIKGSLDVGQLIAVINAYKELPGPLKELIDWDLARQDMQVKYEQVVDQFASDSLVPTVRQDMDAQVIGETFDPLQIRNLNVASEGGGLSLQGIDLRIRRGEAVALSGGSTDGPVVLGEVLSGQLRPQSGQVTLGDIDLGQAPEWVSGRVIGYAGPTPWLFAGTVRDNLFYGLRRRPGSAPLKESAAQASARAWARAEAARAGNPVLDHDVDWIDAASVRPQPDPNHLPGPVTTSPLIGPASQVLNVVGLLTDVIGLGLRAHATAEERDLIAPQVLRLRHSLRETLQEHDLSNLIRPFEIDRYNSEANVGENLLFGLAEDDNASGEAVNAIIRSRFFRQVLDETGLEATLFALGWNFARSIIDIFGAADDGTAARNAIRFLSDDDIPELAAILERSQPDLYMRARRSDRERLMRLAAFYAEPAYRLGLLNRDIEERVIAGRRMMIERMPENLRGLIQTYDSNSYMAGATLLENIVFGKINRRAARAEARLEEMIRQILVCRFEEEPGLRERIVALGLGSEAGAGGRRLTHLQRQKLALARVLIRDSDFYVFNAPLAGVDPALHDQLMGQVLDFLRARPRPPGVIWMLSGQVPGTGFDRVVRLSAGRIVEDAAMPPPVSDTLTPA